MFNFRIPLSVRGTQKQNKSNPLTGLSCNLNWVATHASKPYAISYVILSRLSSFLDYNEIRTSSSLIKFSCCGSLLSKRLL